MAVFDTTPDSINEPQTHSYSMLVPPSINEPGAGGGGGGGSGTAVWHQMKLGAGGQLTYIDVASDGTLLVRADIHGAYVWDTTLVNPGNDYATRPTGCWRQVVNAVSIPNAASLPYPGEGFGSGIQVYEARIAPSNSSRMYMYLGNGYDYGYFYTSTDKGKTWSWRSAAPNYAAGSNGNGKFMGPFMAVDPFNEQIVFMGTVANGIWYSINAGSSWNQVPTAKIPVCTTSVGDQNGGHLVAFDASSFVSISTPVIYATTYGIGVYKSTDYGANWTLLNSTRMPVWPGKLFVDLAGVVWSIAQPDAATVAIGHLMKYKAGVWTDCSTGTPAGTGIPSDGATIRSVAIEPISGAGRRIIAHRWDTAGTWLSTDEGATWGNEGFTQLKVADDIPWLAMTGEWSVAHLNYGADGNVYMAMGIGTFFTSGASIGTNIPSITPVSWTSRSVGNEMLVNEWIVSPPSPATNIMVSHMDRGVMTPSQAQYPSALNIGTVINHGRSCDYASSDPTFLAVGAGGGNITANAGYSTNSGGAWTKFVNQPGGGGVVTGGAIAAASPTNIVTFLRYTGGLWYTKDRGVTAWLACGGLNPAGGWIDFSADAIRVNVCADRVNIGTFYAYCDGTQTVNQAEGFYKSVDGGANWTLYCAGVYHLGYSPPGGPDTAAHEMQMRCVPGTAGNFYCSTGRNQPSMQYPFYELQDNGTTLVRTRVVGVHTVRSYGYGKPLAGTYPAIYIHGFVDAAHDVVAVGGRAVWRSDNHCASWNRVSATSYPGDSLDAVRVISGDMNVIGRCYAGFIGSGVMTYGTVYPPPPPVIAPPPMTIEGGVHKNASTAIVTTTTLTTTSTNDYIMVSMMSNAASDTLTVKSGSGTSFTKIASGGSPNNYGSCWALFSAGIFNDTIVVTQGAAGFCTVDAFGVAGSGQTSLVFDSGGPQFFAGDPVSITTANPYTMVIAGFRAGVSDPTAGTGFTVSPGGGHDWFLTEYKTRTVAGGNSCTMTTGAGTANGSYAVAIVQVG